MSDLIVSVPDHCLSFYFIYQKNQARMLLYNTGSWSAGEVLTKESSQHVLK